ncbi:MAG: zinc ribbon domain-containing protein [Prochloraceae cyanobacterium]
MSDRWHSCPHCEFSVDRDLNAAINIRNRTVGHSVLKAHRVSEAIAGVAEKPEAVYFGFAEKVFRCR